MASLYNLEPQPTAKAILNTTAGDLTLELFGKQAPLATRNFLQHCLDGYYENTIFHRLVPGFIIQGGDPTGSGSGGVSAIDDGRPFQDEFHSRLKFNRRGLLGMANEGKDSNGSQFFLTLGVTPELQGRNTMFGRVEGDTIFNLMKMSEADMAEKGSERPLFPTRITGAEVLVNPFDYMVARVKVAPRSAADDREQREVKKRKKPAGKNVLSFGGDDGDEEEVTPVVKKSKANPKLISAGAEVPEKLNNTKLPEAPAEKKAAPEQRRKPSPPAASSSAPLGAHTRALPRRSLRDADDGNDDDEPVEGPKRQEMLDKTNAEIAALKASMRRTVDTAPVQQNKPKSALEAMIPATSTRGRKRGKITDERGALDLFKSFRQRLVDLPSLRSDIEAASKDRPDEPATNGRHSSTAADEPVDEEAELCDLHFIANCQSCKAWDEEKPDDEAKAKGDDDPGWMSHKLTFAKDVLGKDLEWKRKMEEIEVIDPREKARAIKEERKSGKSGKKR